MRTSVTIILNSELFNYMLDLEVKKATRYSYFFSLLFIEVDQEADSEVADAIARLIVDEIREVDIVGKIERKGFSALLQAETKPTFSIGERIRGRVQSYSFGGVSKMGEPFRTVSVGGACFPTHGTDAEEIRTEAAEMLRKARALGGNKVLVQGVE